MIRKQSIEKKLKEIIDPELGADIVSLDFIKNIKIENGEVSIELRLTTPGCPLSHFFIKEIEEKVKMVKGVEKVKVVLV